MKKSVIVMAGLLAMALAGSAQAAPMFAVQDNLNADKFTVDAAGKVNAEGQPLNAGGPFSAQLDKAPVGAVGLPLQAGAGVFHVASEGLSLPLSSFLVQHAAWPTTPGGATYSGSTASNFSFYRINKNDVTGVYSLPAPNNSLGYFNFGTLDLTKDVNTAQSRKNIAQFLVKVEGTWASITDTPTYFSWNNAATGAVPSEKMRLSSVGNLGIGTTAPTSKLHVVGLPVFADNAAALTGGLTAGAFYRTATGSLMVAF